MIDFCVSDVVFVFAVIYRVPNDFAQPKAKPGSLGPLHYWILKSNTEGTCHNQVYGFYIEQSCSQIMKRVYILKDNKIFCQRCYHDRQTLTNS